MVRDEEQTGTSQEGTVKKMDEEMSALSPKIIEIPMMKVILVEMGLDRMICMPEISMKQVTKTTMAPITG